MENEKPIKVFNNWLQNCSISTKQTLIRAILQDNVDEMRRIVKKDSELLSSPIQHVERHDDSNLDNYSVQHAVPLSIVSKSVKCFKELLNLGSELEVFSEPSRNNVLHLLVYSDFSSTAGSEMYDILLEKMSVKQRRTLHSQRNREGLTPLELAAKFSNSSLFKHFLYTEGVFRHILKDNGTTVKNEFSFQISRDGTSILEHLVDSEDTKEATQFLNEVVRYPVIVSMINRIVTASLPWIILWSALWLAVAALCFKVELDIWLDFHDKVCVNWPMNVDTNTSILHWLSGKENEWPLYNASKSILPLWGFLAILFDIFEYFYLNRTFRDKLIMVKNFFTRSAIVNTPFYILVRSLSSWIFLTVGIMELNLVHTREGILPILVVLYLLNLVLVTFGTLYFIQLLPLIGFFAIGFQKMLTAILKFGLLNVSIEILFAILFTYARTYSCTVSESICENMLNVYKTFLVMLNMMPVIPEDSKCDEWGETTLKLLHVVYVFTVAILVLNYLIAIMTSVYSKFTHQENCVVTLHRLHIALIIQRRLDMVGKFLPLRFRSKRQKETFVVDEICTDFKELKNLRLKII